jgi:flagellar biosynthesis chaperone FliJ
MQPDNLAINVQKQLAKINQHIDQQMDSVIWLIQVIQELFDNFQKNKKTKAII